MTVYKFCPKCAQGDITTPKYEVGDVIKIVSEEECDYNG